MEAQRQRVFATGEGNPFGAGTWVIHVHEQDGRIEIVKTSDDLVLQMRIAVSPAAGEPGAGGPLR